MDVSYNGLLCRADNAITGVRLTLRLPFSPYSIRGITSDYLSEEKSASLFGVTFFIPV
jgi:hypothetical protein